MLFDYAYQRRFRKTSNCMRYILMSFHCHLQFMIDDGNIPNIATNIHLLVYPLDNFNCVAHYMAHVERFGQT